MYPHMIDRRVKFCALVSVGRFSGRQSHVRVEGDDVLLCNGYDLKDRFRAVGFRWRPESKCWALPVDRVSALLDSVASRCRYS